MPAAGIRWLNMWTNLSVLNVKDNGFITPIISDVSRVQTMLIPGSMLLNSLPVWRAGTGITDPQLKDTERARIVMETSF